MAATAVSDSLNLGEMLNEHWIQAIGDIVRTQTDVETYLGLGRDKLTIPERKLTFTSLNQLPPQDINVVIFGQDPYPRAASAVGVAFNDGEIHNWTDKFSPSFANLVKNVLYGKGLVRIDQGVADVRKTLAKEGVLPPPAWFEHTIKSGVCWLNMSLTFTSVDTTVLAQHLKFWRPIIEGILAALINAKKKLRKSGNPNAGLVFVLWGGHAQKLQKLVEALNTSSGDPIDLIFVKAPHPAANGSAFHVVKTFEAVDQALEKLGLPAIDWLPKGHSPAASSAPIAVSTTTVSVPAVDEEESGTTKKRKAPAKKTAKKVAAVSDDSDEEFGAKPAPKKRAKRS